MCNNLKSFDVEHIHLEVTGKCNLDCVYCYNSRLNNKKKIKEEMKTQDIKRLIDEAGELGCEKIVFTGGEPFLRSDIFDIIEYCKNKKICFLTNGKLLTNEFIERLSKYPQIKQIRITLDGFEEHNKIRVNSDYKQIIQSIKSLNNKKIPVVINTEVIKKNLSDMPKLYTLLKELKIHRWRVDLPFVAGRYQENYKDFKLPDLKDYIATFKNILIDYIAKKTCFEFELFEIYKSEVRPTNLMSFNKDIHPCDYGRVKFDFRPNGDMVFCPGLDFPMANFIKEGNLKKALEKKYKHEFYNLKIADIKECQNCRYLKLCGTGCRINPYYYRDDYKKADPVLCNLMPLVEKEIIPIMPKDLKSFLYSLIDENANYPKKFNLIELANKNLKRKKF